MTALHDFSSDELEYFERQYPEDLEHIFALCGPEMPLLIFTGTRDNRHVEEWQEHFALIERRIDFLFCLFLFCLFVVFVCVCLCFSGVGLTPEPLTSESTGGSCCLPGGFRFGVGAVGKSATVIRIIR